jgi:hypothetical protein
MVFGAAACALLLLGLGKFITQLVYGSVRVFIALINVSVEFGNWLKWGAAFTARMWTATSQMGKAQDNEKAPADLPLLARLFILMLVSNEEYENIAGDLQEDFICCKSKAEAYRRLYKQIITSVCPLTWKTIKNRLASVFSKRAR